MTLPSGFISELAARAAAHAEGMFAGMSRRCDSPIEAIFLTALYFSAEPYGGFFFEEPIVGPKAMFFVKLQEPILTYRADFVVGLYDHPEAQRIVVECDGHDYHERTKEQAAHDRRRDREMQSAGYKVFRFTGSEIFRDALKCADEVISEALRIDDGVPR